MYHLISLIRDSDSTRDVQRIGPKYLIQAPAQNLALESPRRGNK